MLSAARPPAPASALRASVFEALAAGALRSLSEGQAKWPAPALAKLAFALATAGSSAPLLEAALAARCEAVDWAAVDSRPPLAQLHAWRLWQAERGVARAVSPALAQRLRSACEAASREELAGLPAKPGARARATAASLREAERQQLCSALVALGATSHRRQVASAIGYTLDVQVQWQGRTVGLVIDGPAELLRHARTLEVAPEGDAAAVRERAPPPPSHRPNGWALMRRRQLRGACPVVAVPFWQWKQVAAKTIEVDALLPGLRAALDEAVAAGDEPTWARELAAEREARKAAERQAARQAAEEEAMRAEPAPGPREAPGGVDGTDDAERGAREESTTQTGRVKGSQHEPVAKAKENASMMSWNEFRGSKKGKGLSMAEIGRLWRAYKEAGFQHVDCSAKHA